MVAHDFLQRSRGLMGMIEGHPANMMVQDMRLDSSVEKETTNPAKVTVDGTGGTAQEGPGGGAVVRETYVGVLEKCHRHYLRLVYE